MFNFPFAKSVLTLMTGTTIAQAIPIAISPVLTRMYSPEDFGALAIFISIATVLSVVANLRYQLAIAQPKKDDDAASIMILSVIITIIVSLISLIIIIIFREHIKIWLEDETIEIWLYLVPVSVLTVGIYQSVNYWYVRKKYFRNIATSKMSQGVVGGASQLIFGSVAAGPLGLIFGFIFGQIAAILALLIYISGNWQVFQNVTLKKILKNVKKYKRMPLYSAPGAIVDSLSAQLPNFFIVKYFDLISVGFFGLVFRVLNVPLALISGALGQVLLQRVADRENKKQMGGSERAFLLKIFIILLLIIFPFVMIIRSYGEIIFVFTFGEQWRIAGEMAGVLVIAVAIRFAVAPLSVVMALERNIKKGVMWQFSYLVTISSTLIYFSGHELFTFIKAFVVHEVLLYSIYFILILQSAPTPQEKK